MLNERSHTPKNAHFMMPFIRGVAKHTKLSYDIRNPETGYFGRTESIMTQKGKNRSSGRWYAPLFDVGADYLAVSFL